MISGGSGEAQVTIYYMGVQIPQAKFGGTGAAQCKIYGECGYGNVASFQITLEFLIVFVQCVDAVHWAAGRACSL